MRARSSSTPSRLGCCTMSASASSAMRKPADRQWTRYSVASCEVPPPASAPMSSKKRASALAGRVALPRRNSSCSRKCEIPRSPSLSSTEPTRTHTPTAVDSDSARRAVTTRTPDGSRVSMAASKPSTTLMLTRLRLVRFHTGGMGAEMHDLWRPVDPADGRLRTGLEAMMDARSRAIDAGERPIGWKIGWNAPAVRERMRVRSSVLGFLVESGVRPASEPVPLEGTTKPGAEVEIAIWVGPHATIARVAPGIELVDFHGDVGDALAALEANVWNHGCVVGESQEWSPGLLDGIEVRVDHNGEPFGAPARPPDAIGDPEKLVRFAADTVSMLGEELREGDLILSGLLVPSPVMTKPGDRLVADYGPLGRLELEFA